MIEMIRDVFVLMWIKSKYLELLTRISFMHDVSKHLDQGLASLVSPYTSLTSLSYPCASLMPKPRAFEQSSPRNLSWVFQRSALYGNLTPSRTEKISSSLVSANAIILKVFR
jgi:hypothetical protein